MQWNDYCPASWQPQREQQFISIRYFSLVHPMLSFVLVIPEYFRLGSFVSPRLLRTGATAPPHLPALSYAAEGTKANRCQSGSVRRKSRYRPLE